MANVYRDPARSTIETAYKKFGKQIIITLISLFIIGIIIGFLPSLTKYPLKIITAIIIGIASLLIIYTTTKYLDKKLDSLKDEEINHVKGAQGEIAAGLILENILPDEYNLLYDIPTNRGNIDLLIIGPTGVHAIDVKNWKGKITSNKDGNLVQNGEQRNYRPNNFLSICIEEIKKKIGLNHINCIITFPHNDLNISEELKEKIIFTSLENLSTEIIKKRTEHFNKIDIEELTHTFEKFAHNKENK